MASHRRFGETQLMRRGIMIAALLLWATGCRSTGGFSRMPGMGWLAGSQRSNDAGRTEIDPTASLPAPSSVSTPETLAEQERRPAAPEHATVSYEAPPSQGSPGAPVNYPSTGYSQIAPGTQGTRPEPNPTGIANAATATTGSDYVQQGPYSAPAPSPQVGAATTWDSTAPTRPATTNWNPPAPPPSGSIYSSATTPPVAIVAENPISSSPPGDSVYGAALSAPAPNQNAQDTTWPDQPAPTVYPPVPAASQVPPPPDQGAVPGPVAPASYEGATGSEPSHYQRSPAADDRSATSASEPWRPGSTASYGPH